MTTTTETPLHPQEEFRKYITEKTGATLPTLDELDDLCNSYVRRLRAHAATTVLDSPNRDERIKELAKIANLATRAIRMEMDLPQYREIGDARQPHGWSEFPAVHRLRLEAESKMLNSLAWTMAVALGDVVTEEDKLVGTPAEQMDRLLDELKRLRAAAES